MFQQIGGSGELAILHGVLGSTAEIQRTQGAVWCQIIADVLRRPLLVARGAEATCLGSGMLPAAAVGLYPSIRDAATAMSDTGAVYLPHDGRAAACDGLDRVYRQLYPRLKDVFAELSEVTR